MSLWYGWWPWWLWPIAKYRLADCLAAPSLAGLLLIGWQNGIPGVKNVIYRLTPWSAGRAWPMLFLCLALPLACVLLSNALFAACGIPVSFLSKEDPPCYLSLAVIGKGLMGAGLYEEVGWRAFLLPCLQRRYSALASSVAIGLMWALWHVPYFLFESPFPWRYVALFIPQVVVYATIFTWVYNTTGGNLLAVILLHGAINARSRLSCWHGLQDTAINQLLGELPFLLIAAGLLWRYGPSHLSRYNRIMAPMSGEFSRNSPSDRFPTCASH